MVRKVAGDGLLYHRFQHVRSWTETTRAGKMKQCSFSVIETGTTDFVNSIHALYRTTPLPIRVARSAVKTLLNGKPHLFGDFAKTQN
jgi:hypothetical protein